MYELRRLILRKIEDASLSWIVGSFVITILIFAGIYWLLTPWGNGVISGGDQQQDSISLLNSIYFSVVTISSLGYGDLHPIGFSRFVSAFEVLIGLAMMGIVVAKLSSSRISYHVRRLYGSDAQRRLREFFLSLEELHEDVKKAVGVVSRSLNRVGTTSSKQERQEQQNIELFRRTIETFRVQCFTLKDYVKREIDHGDFFTDAPIQPVLDCKEMINEIILEVDRLFVSLPIQARTRLLTLRARKAMRDTLVQNLELCAMVEKHDKKMILVHGFRSLRESCTEFQNTYLNIPLLSVEFEQPNQVLRSSNEPEVGEDDNMDS